MSDTARRLGPLEAFCPADGVSHPPSPDTTISTTAIRVMPRGRGKGGATWGRRAGRLHCDWAHGHSTTPHRVSRQPDFVVKLGQLRGADERIPVPDHALRCSWRSMTKS